MESATWPETLPRNRIKAIHELTGGVELTNNLREILECPRKIEYDLTNSDDVVVGIIAMFENTLSILASCTSDQHLLNPKSDLCSPCSSDGQKSENSGKSAGTIIPAKPKRGCYKRRKNSWTSSQVTSTLVDDGHAWRKYGQKHINNAEYERSYYRCTYKIDQGCLAAKQVQKIQDNPPKYKTTYIGNHTCKNLQRSPQIILDSLNPGDTSILLNFETKELISNTQAGPFLPSIKQEVKECFGYQGGLNQFPSSNNYLSRGLNTCVSPITLEPISDMYSELNNRDMISSRVSLGSNHQDVLPSWTYSSMSSPYVYETKHDLRTKDFNDFQSEF